jgi:hypothetical protein
MSHIASIIAVALASLIVAAGAGASQDLRSPDARASAPVAQDFRSPDARTAAPAAAPFESQDLRSPDARDIRNFVTEPQAPAHTSGGVEWAFLAIAVSLGLMLVASVLLVQRRRRHALVVGR